MHVDRDRLRSDLEELATFGADRRGGVTRPAYSDAERAARAWLASRCADAGLGYREDGIGNAFIRLDGPPGPAVWTGSHLDTVPNGGRFDGALGVLAGLECLRCLAEHGVPLARPVEAVAFADEEGAYLGFLGSRSLVADRSADELAAITGADGRRLVDALGACGFPPEAATRTAVDPGAVHSFVELHVEQGAVLEAVGAEVGLVTGIVGIGRGQVTFEGRPDHAGTTPMTLRRDALRAAAEFLTGLYRIPVSIGADDAVVTCGRVDVEPGAYGIVPAAATALLDFRDADATALGALEAAIVELAASTAATWEVTAEYRRQSLTRPLPLDPVIRSVIAEVVAELGLVTMAMPSGAGHDAQVIGQIAPAAMIFVPSRDGRSHSPLEHTDWDDVGRGADALLGTVHRLATR